MNRTVILLLAVLLLGGATYLLTRSNDSPRLAETSADRQFAYENVDNIQRIHILDRKGNEVNLTRGGRTGWMVDGKYPANENIIKNLLKTVGGIEIRTLPTYAAVPNLVRSLATNGILVQLFDEAGGKLRGYYIGGANNDETGTMAIMEDSENPYIVHLPGFTGNVRFRFNLIGDEWRSKVILSGDPDEVEYLEIEYPRDQANSFRLTSTGEDYELKPLTVTTLPTRKVTRGAAEAALVRFEKFYVARYENEDAESQRMARETLPYAFIKLKVAGREEQNLSIYPRFQDKTVATKEGTTQLENIEAYLGYTNNGEDWVLLSPNTTEPLFVTYGSF